MSIASPGQAVGQEDQCLAGAWICVHCATNLSCSYKYPQGNTGNFGTGPPHNAISNRAKIAPAESWVLFLGGAMLLAAYRWG